jgi:hypothetical protein
VAARGGVIRDSAISVGGAGRSVRHVILWQRIWEGVRVVGHERGNTELKHSNEKSSRVRL